jgi:hypothetical protein
VRRLLQLVPLLAILAMLVSYQSASAQSPADECAAIGMTFVTKLQGIPDPGDGPNNFTGPTVEGPAAGGSATIQWTKNPNSLTIVSTTFDFDSYVEKRGEGGGLSHITFCEEDDPPATDPPATDPPATDPPATDPPATDPPATDPPATNPPGTTVTPTVPGATVTPTVPGSTEPAKTPVSVLPNTGASPSGDGQGELLLIAGVAVLFGGAAWIATRAHEHGHSRD